MIRRWFPLAPGGEWTVEANPGTLDEAKADVPAGAGGAAHRGLRGRLE